MILSTFILIMTLLAAAFYDIKSGRIPNRLTFSAMLLAIIYNTSINGLEGLIFSIEGAGLGIILLIIFYFLGGMGAGDVKLMGAVGSILGPKGVFIAFILTALAGGLYAIILLAINGHIVNTLKRYLLILRSILQTKKIFYIPPPEEEKKVRLRYGLSIAAGTILSIFMKDNLYSFFNL